MVDRCQRAWHKVGPLAERISDRGKFEGDLGGLLSFQPTVRGCACPTRLNVPILPESQPHTEHDLGSAEDPHPVRLLDEPHPDPACATGADHPQLRMLPGGQKFYEPIPDRDYRESLYKSPLPHGAFSSHLRAASRAR